MPPKKSSGSKLESTMYEFNKQMINCFIIEDVLIQICLLRLYTGSYCESAVYTNDCHTEMSCRGQDTRHINVTPSHYRHRVAMLLCDLL